MELPEAGVISVGLMKMVVSFSNGQPVAVTTFTR